MSVDTSASQPKKRTTRSSTSASDLSYLEPVINKSNRSYQFGDSDVTLISSDNIRFKVHTFHLMAASAVFRDMLSIGKNGHQGPEVRLTDKAIESSWVISLFLRTCYGHSLPHYTDVKDGYLGLIAFIDKYDCKVARESLITLVNSWMGLDSQRLYPNLVMSIASQLDDNRLAKRAISLGGHWEWSKVTTEEPTESVARQRLRVVRQIPLYGAFDLTAWAFEDFKKIPEDYKFALLRACQQGKPLFDHKEADWTAIADSFEIILSAIRENKK
ncbi:hypothetical protein I317_02830 [Kwoniella heveanensis CBS 569]|nr:hypothetical protein I317_02830 [Kwoniella heveanensis CBS 569]